MRRELGLDLPTIVEGAMPTYEELDGAIDSSVSNAIEESSGNIGVLLSGGVDSSLLLSFVLRHQNVPVFTVATDISHPDLEAAQRLAKEYKLKHYVIMPTKDDLDEAYTAMKGRKKIFPGDAGVYIALKWAKENEIDTILASDGIDEQVGGYWWHANNSDRFASREEAFQYFWGATYDEQIAPMLESSNDIGVEIKFPFLDRNVVSVINRIPLDKRVEEGNPKSWWKNFAREYIPGWIIDRKKIGFVSALDEEITRKSIYPIRYEVDYEKDEIPRKKVKTSPKIAKVGGI